MSTEQNKAIVRRLFEAFNQGDLGVVDELVDSAFVNHNSQEGLAPDREGYRQYLAEVRASFPDVELAIEDFIAEADKVAVAALAFLSACDDDFSGLTATETIVGSGVIASESRAVSGFSAVTVSPTRTRETSLSPVMT